jgi:hypothetical protein
MHLLSNLCAAEAAVFDDRALNKELFAQDGTGFRARSITSLDIIEELLGRGVITETDRRNFRHRLRVAGAMLIPVDVEEIVHAAMRSKAGVSREFRAIRENLDLARIAEMPRFPAEIPWFGSFAINAKSAVMQVWMREKDWARAAALSEMILNLRPRAESWLARWEGDPPPGWVEAVGRMTTASLAMPVEFGHDEDLRAYHKWLEERILEPMRRLRPDGYKAMIEYVRMFILNSADDEDGDDEAS